MMDEELEGYVEAWIHTYFKKLEMALSRNVLQQVSLWGKRRTEVKGSHYQAAVYQSYNSRRGIGFSNIKFFFFLK